MTFGLRMGQLRSAGCALSGPRIEDLLYKTATAECMHIICNVTHKTSHAPRKIVIFSIMISNLYIEIKFMLHKKKKKDNCSTFHLEIL